MYDLRFVLHSGAIAPTELHATIVTTGTQPLVFVICRDITERRRMEQEREELKKQVAAAQKMELVGMLASGIAHDFNNVLSALTGYASLLQMNLAGSDAITSEYAGKISEIATKGQALTDRLMSFIRKKREELVPIDIHKVLKDTELMLRPNSKHIDIKLDLGAENCFVLGDESQIHGAFLNLGLNARDAMPNGGELVFKTYNEEGCAGSERKGCGFIRVDVIDGGTGMDEQVVRKIFDPLFTTKDPGKGTGLGLPGVLYCVKNLHGYIDVESKAGDGTTFKVTLPLYSQDTMGQIDLSGKRVMIITDNFEAADMMSEKLSYEGIRARHFDETEAALEWLKKGNAEKTAAIIIDFDFLLFDDNGFLEEIAAAAPKKLIIKILSRDQVSLGSNRDYVAFINTPIDSDMFFESLAMYIRDRAVLK
jgi:signal transduction histidine kinase